MAIASISSLDRFGAPGLKRVQEDHVVAVQPLTAGVRPRPIRRDCFRNLDAEVAARKSQQKIGALALFEVERITENVRRGIRSPGSGKSTIARNAQSSCPRS
jgi:hypothetical protein